MSAIEFKFVAIGAIFITGLLGGALALRLDRTQRPEVFFSLGSALAAGVFLGAGLIHMLPDAVAGFSQMLPHMDYPLAALLAGSGFVLILALERVVLARASQEGAVEAAVSQTQVFPYALTVILSLHSILTGIALGAEGTVLGSVVIFVAIIAHKGSAAFALAVSLHRGGLARSAIFKIIAGFSLTTPLGIGIGIGFNAILGGRAGHGFEAAFDSLAAGTFFYIASLDIVHEEFTHPRRLWPKLGLLCAGLGLMALIAVWM